MPTKAERDVANAMIKDMLNATFGPEDIVALAQHQAFLDVATGSVPWEQAPPDIQAKFVKQPTASDDEFNAALNEARESRKK